MITLIILIVFRTYFGVVSIVFLPERHRILHGGTNISYMYYKYIL